jgi:hypothetical protein
MEVGSSRLTSKCSRISVCDFILYILYFLRVVQKKGALVYALRVDSSYLINGRGTSPNDR